MYTVPEKQTKFHVTEGRNPSLLTDNRGETLMVMLINWDLLTFIKSIVNLMQLQIKVDK